jgi:hypothetical protein
MVMSFATSVRLQDNLDGKGPSCVFACGRRGDKKFHFVRGFH